MTTLLIKDMPLNEEMDSNDVWSAPVSFFE